MLEDLLLQLGFGGDTNFLTLILFYLPFVLFLLYGQRLQFHMSLLEIRGSLRQFEQIKDFAKTETIEAFKRKGTGEEKARQGLEVMTNYFTILPESLDPAGVVSKLEHVVDVRDDKMLGQVKNIVSDIDDAEARNLENLVEVTAALTQLYKQLRHFYLLGKKTNNIYLVVQLQMMMSLLMIQARAYLTAVRAFQKEIPIGDGIGPLIASRLMRGNGTKEIAKETVVADAKFEERKAIVVKALGPGGNVGKPGEAIRKILEENEDSVKLVIMIDAALKLEGEEAGEVAEGVGAAIGGIGVDKFKIEEATSEYGVPVHGVVIKQSLADAVSIMKKGVYNSVDKVTEKLKNTVSLNTDEDDTVIIAGIGNTMGIGQ